MPVPVFVYRCVEKRWCGWVPKNILSQSLHSPNVDIVYTNRHSFPVDIIWDEPRNGWLKTARGVSFEQIAGIIEAEQYLDIVENPTREKQEYFVVSLLD